MIQPIRWFGLVRQLSRQQIVYVVATALVLVIAGPIHPLSLNADKQTAPTPDRLPRFEVASIKRTKSGQFDSRQMSAPPGRFSATNVTIWQIFKNAYQIEDSRIIGAPPWFEVDRFDIVAKRDGRTAELLSPGRTVI